MKIQLNCGDYKPTIDHTGEAELSGVYNGIGIPTDQGYFGIAQRDGGLEIVLDGVLIFATYDPEMLDALAKIRERRQKEFEERCRNGAMDSGKVSLDA